MGLFKKRQQPPSVENSVGASGVTATEATLHGFVSRTGKTNPEVTIYWGTKDGQEVPKNWEGHSSMRERSLGGFFYVAKGLHPNTTYYYRIAAQSPQGKAWTPASSFQTREAIVPGAYKGRLFLVFPSHINDDKEILRTVFGKIRGMAGEGWIEDARFIARGEEVQFTVQLGEKELARRDLMTQFPDVLLRDLAEDRVKIELPAGT